MRTRCDRLRFSHRVTPGGCRSTDFHIFKKEMWQMMLLAGPGVVLSSMLTAIFAKYVFPYEWGWFTALTFGSMMSATDPVAVVALLRELGASKRLSLLIEGESLLNDGTAMVVFVVFMVRASFAPRAAGPPLTCAHAYHRMLSRQPICKRPTRC